MSDSSTNLDLISPSQSSKEVTANALFDAMSPNAIFGRRAATTAAVTWGYYGGAYRKADGTIIGVANGTLTLADNSLNYIIETDGVVSSATVAPSGWPAPLTSGANALYLVQTISGTITGYSDFRTKDVGTNSTPFVDTTALVKGSADPTKQIRFEVDGLTPATTRVLTAPDKDGTIAMLSDLPPTTKGDLFGFDTGYARIPIGTNGWVLTADSGQALGLKWAAPPSGALTTKGDILGFDTAVNRVPVGTDGHVLMADSAEALGLKWAASSAGTLTTKGDLLAYDTGLNRLPVGTNGQQLVADSGQALGMKWASEPFDVHAFYPGSPTTSAKVLRVPVARAIAFPANFSGSYGTASAAATGSTAFDVQKNGVSIGTITFAGAASTATFATTGGSAQSLAAGDILSIIAPGSPDATLADVGFVLAGTR